MTQAMKIESDLGEALEQIQRLKRWPAIAQAVVERHTELIARKAKELARTRAFDEGDLVNSIQSLGTRIAGDIIEGTVEVGVDYASYLEFGTSSIDGRHFMTDALEEGLEPLIRDLIQSFNQLVDRR